MQQAPGTQQVHISPVAILAAVLYNMHKTMQVKVTPDDGATPIKMEVPAVEIQIEGNSLICALPMKTLVHFAQTAYEMTFNVVQPHNNPNPDDALAMVGFEKTVEKTRLLGADGKSAAPAKSFEKLMAKFVKNGTQEENS